MRTGLPDGGNYWMISQLVDLEYFIFVDRSGP